MTDLALPPPEPAELIRALIDSGLTGEKVAGLEKLADLYERFEAKKAERAFTAAFVALQAELPPIVASTPIPNRGKYERFEDVMEVVGPLLRKHGFSVSFDMGPRQEGRVTMLCHLDHVGGHSKLKEFSVRTGRKADSDTQADTMAATTAKRNALLNSLNIVVRQDALTTEEDPRIEGDYISPELADQLERRIAESNSNKAKFLKLAGAASFAEMSASKYEVLDQLLREKEQRGR